MAYRHTPPDWRRGSPGFSLLEAAIAIAVIAILAGAAAPLVMKAVNQQREQKTRDNVRLAYEAIAGARDRRISNMKADFGFNPPVPPAQLADLRFMTTINPAAAYRNGPVPPAYGAVAANLRWGWNGPYWTGSIRPQAGTNGIPLDGWGRPLRWANNQVQSAGVDGVLGNADDLVFPVPPGLPATNLTVAVDRQPPAPPPPPGALVLTVTVTHRSGNVALASTPLAPATATTWAAGVTGSRTNNFAVNPGPVSVVIVEGANTSTQIVDLLPGESKTVYYRTVN